MKIGSLFSGYGGLDLAVEHVFGARTAWHAEWEDAPSKVLARHWPGVPNYRDVTTVDWAAVPPVDIITGGFPCQDVSLAGRRAGMTEGTRSNLWGAMRTAVETIRPRFVVAENVRGLLSAKAYSSSDVESGDRPMGGPQRRNLRALGRVLGDLADCGYDAQWGCLRASSVGAPHQRERIFILAWRRDVEDPHSFRVGRGSYVPRQGEGNGEYPAAPRAGFGLGVPQSVEVTPCPSSLDWGPYQAVVRQWEALHRPAPDPTSLNSRGTHRLDARFTEWMMGLPEGWVTGDPSISRFEGVKMCGNGVLPHQAAEAISQMLARLEYL